MRLVFDLEGDGLQPTKFWCMSALDMNTHKVYEFGPDDISKGINLLKKAEVLCGHNIIAYDLYWLKQLYGVDLTEGKEIIDTLVWSRMFDPDRTGGHSLAAWGKKLAQAKPEHEDWSQYSEAMQHRCTEDVRINFRVYHELRKRKRIFTDDSVDLEQRIAKIMHEQEIHGWFFNVKEAYVLRAKVSDELGRIEDEVRETFRPKKMFVKRVTPKKKKDGTLSKQGLRPCEYERLKTIGFMESFDRYDTIEFNLGSRQQIGRWLTEDFGWQPTEFTETGQPKIDEKVLEGVTDIPEAKLIHRYLMLQKINSFLINWLDSVSDDGRQHGFVKTIGTVTRRMAHSKPNLAQVPSARKLYGAECRKLFTVPSGYKLVGLDAEGLELRMLAHYMDNPDYTKAVVSGNSKDGTDAHTLNMKLAGLDNRDQAKTMFYALIYGAGYRKLGQIIGGGSNAGRKLKHTFLNELPDLGDLISRVETAASRGFIKCFDGSVLNVRSIRSSLNTLLQGGGSVVVKRACVMLYDEVKRLNLDAHQVGFVHDELQWEVNSNDVDKFREVADGIMRKAGDYYNLRCPMDGNTVVGSSWLETH